MNEIYKSYVYHLISFDKFFRSCNPVAIKIENITSAPKSFSVLCLPTPSKATTIFILFPLNQFCLSSVWNHAVCTLFLCVKRLLLNIIFLRFIHAVLSISTLVPVYWRLVFQCMNIPLFVCTFLLMDTWSLSSFWLL